MQKMIPHGDLPDDIEAVGRLEVCFDHLAQDAPESCPVPLRRILRYIELELPTDDLPASALHFVRTAQVQDKEYWVWRLDDEYLDDEHYVTVSREPGGATCISYRDNCFNLNLDQFLLADYCNLF